MFWSDFCNNAFGSCARRRHKEFKEFFAVQYPVKSTPIRKLHPNWEIQVILRHAIIVNKDAIFLGSSLSCDEETMGCKGRHTDILCIYYKKEGDWFQCNVLVSDGYTYTFFLRNQPAPTDIPWSRFMSATYKGYVTSRSSCEQKPYHWYGQSLHQCEKFQIWMAASRSFYVPCSFMKEGQGCTIMFLSK